MVQMPDSDGVRSATVGVLRDTYRNLYATTMKTWLNWVPREIGRYVGSDDRPAVHEFEFDAPWLPQHKMKSGGGKCRLRVEWRALGAQSVETTCRGWEIHGAFIDEADTVDDAAPSFLAGRVQRGGELRTRVTRGVWMAFNKSDTDHPLYTRCVDEAEDHEANDFGFFDQPPAILPGGPPYVINPAAENLENLNDDYYEKSAKGQPEWYVRRMIRNQWGASVSGEPVFGQLDLDRIFSPVELEPDPGEEIFIGLDGGGTPAAAIWGRKPNGRRVKYAEVVLTDPLDPRGRRILHGVGPKRFTKALGDALHPRFSRCRIIGVWADPSAFYGADREQGEFSDLEAVCQNLSLPVLPAPSNELGLRHEAVRQLFLEANASDGLPQAMINPSCRWSRRGYGGDYKWEARDPKAPGKRLKVQKTNSSHALEADQYALLGDQGRAGVVAGRAYDQHRPKQRIGGQAFHQTEGGVWMPDRDSHGHLSGQRGGGGSYGGDWSPWDD